MDIQASAGLVLQVAAAGLVFWITKLYMTTFRFWSSRGVPGPWPAPIFGTNIHYFFKDKIALDMEWREKYGHTYGTYNFHKPMLKTTDNELVADICIKRFKLFRDRDTSFVFSKHMNRWLFFSPAEHWANQRALLTPIFASSKLRRMIKSLRDAMHTFKEFANKRVNGDKAELSKDELMSYTLDSVARTLFGLKLDTYQDKSSEFYKRAFAFAHFDFGYLLAWMCIPAAFKRVFEMDSIPKWKFTYFMSLGQKIIDERRRKMTVTNGSAAPQQYSDMIGLFMQAKLPENNERLFDERDDKEAHHEGNAQHEQLEASYKLNYRDNAIKFATFDDKEVVAHTTFMLIAGFDTTSSSLSFCMYELAHKQQAQQQVYEELREVAERIRARNNDSANNKGLVKFEHDDLLGLTKLDAFVSETLRLYSPVNETQRVVTQPGGARVSIKLADGKVVEPLLPQGTSIGLQPFLIQRDADYWSKPLEWDMSRFEPAQRAQHKTCAYLPFGVGPRSCIGTRFALLNIKLYLAETLCAFKVSPGTDTKQYPPQFKNHLFFLQLKHTSFALEPRSDAV